MTERQTGGSAAPAPPWHLPDRARAIAVLHPAPSSLNATLVACLALVAGAEAWTAAVLTVAMLGFQFSIGALNDVIDADSDRRAGRKKPIPAGRVSMPVARGIVVGGAIVGLVVSARFGWVVLLVGTIGYGAGLAYDVALRQRGLAWLGFAVAFPSLLAWTWLAAAGTLPPGWPLLLPLAAAAGPAIHLANGLVDARTDGQVGVSSLATRLGPTHARWALAGLTGLVYLLGWIALWRSPGMEPRAITAAAGATATAGFGVWLSWHTSRRQLEAGWIAQAIGLAAFGVVLIATAT